MNSHRHGETSRGSVPVFNKSTEVVLRAPIYDKSNKLIGYRKYAYYKTESQLLGEGSFGAVYKIYPIDNKTDQPLYGSPMAVKIYNSSSQFNAVTTEAELFRNYYKGETPFAAGNQFYFIMELFSGTDLFNDTQELNPEFKNLSFGTTVELIFQLCLAIDLIHQHTPSTGSAISHNDAKGKNWKVHITDDGRVNVYLLDFGLSDKVEEIKNTRQAIKGSPLYIPPEALENRIRPKNDIYALVPIFLSLLGACSPFTHKDNAFDEVIIDGEVVFLVTPDVFLANYNFDNILDRFAKDADQIDPSMKKLITQFLQRMQGACDARPNSTELLRFFASLRICYESNQKKLLIESQLKQTKSYASGKEMKAMINHLEESIAKHVCIMTLLAFGLWNNPNAKFIDHEEFQRALRQLYTYNTVNELHLNILRHQMGGFETQINLSKDKISTLEKLGYSKLTLNELYRFCEKQPFIIDNIISHILLRLDERSKKLLNQIMGLLKKYDTMISLEEFRQIVTYNGINPNAAFIACLNTFIERKEMESTPDHFEYEVLSFFKYNAPEEIAVAKKLQAQYKGQLVSFTEKETKLVRTKQLGDLVKDFKICEHTTVQNDCTL